MKTLKRVRWAYIILAALLLSCSSENHFKRSADFNPKNFEVLQQTSIATERRHEKSKYLQATILLGDGDEDRNLRMTSHLKAVYDEFEKLFTVAESIYEHGDQFYYYSEESSGEIGYLLVRNGKIVRKFSLGSISED